MNVHEGGNRDVWCFNTEDITICTGWSVSRRRITAYDGTDCVNARRRSMLGEDRTCWGVGDDFVGEGLEALPLVLSSCARFRS